MNRGESFRRVIRFTSPKIWNSIGELCHRTRLALSGYFGWLRSYIYIVKMSIVKCYIFVNFSSENKFCSVLFCSQPRTQGFSFDIPTSLKEKPWFRLVTCLPDFGRQTNSVIRVGRERGKNVLTA